MKLDREEIVRLIMALDLLINRLRVNDLNKKQLEKSIELRNKLTKELKWMTKN